MSERRLPTWTEIANNSLAGLKLTRTTASSVRDELNSDWRPAGTPLTPQAAEARTEVLRRIELIKTLVDEAKDFLEKAR